MVRDLVQEDDDQPTEGGAGLRVHVVIALAAAGSTVLALLHFSGDMTEKGVERESWQIQRMVAQQTVSPGSLHGMEPKPTTGISLAAVAVVASSLCAAPPGYVLVADSQAQFSGEQGRDGWWYLFDRGEGTPIVQMPYFTPYNATPDNGANAWCPEPIAGYGGSFCMIHRNWSHTNQGYVCDTWPAGLQRPIRRWMAPSANPVVVEVSAILGAPYTSALRAELVVDGVVVQSWLTQYGSVPTINATIPLVSAQQIDFRLDPIDGCAADGCGDLSIRIYSPDCNRNGTADIADIAANPEVDANRDGIPDSCQCLADIFADGQVNGADLGALLSYWGPVTSAPASRACDITSDGRVNGSDLGILLANWGPCGQ